MQHSSTGTSNDRIITIASLDTVIGTPNRSRQIRSQLLQSSRYEIPNDPAVANVLEKEKDQTTEKKKRGRPKKVNQLEELEEQDKPSQPTQTRFCVQNSIKEF